VLDRMGPVSSCSVLLCGADDPCLGKRSEALRGIPKPVDLLISATRRRHSFLWQTWMRAGMQEGLGNAFYRHIRTAKSP